VSTELAELAREARLLAIRSRRQAGELFAGAYASAFRGGGMEFEESRPYVPGDDVRSLDWNATARTGEPHVKRFREERDRSVVVVVDTSASMGFASGVRSKAQTAARAAALLVAAAGHAGDKVGLLAFDDAVHSEVLPGRGPAHTWAALRAAAATGQSPRGATRAGPALERALRLASRRAVIFVVSDFRDASFLGGPLAAACDRHDLVAVAVEDPRERSLPAAGSVRVRDPEQPDATFVLATSSERVRARYAAAAAGRRRALARRLRGAGADLLHLSTDEDPLRALSRFFRARAARARRAA
jgi:uncharacterized protein (DUF58 family)